MQRALSHVGAHDSPLMGSEDFARMLEACPGAYIFIGSGNTDGPFHSPRYDFNDEASRAWWRRSCHHFPIHDIISLLHIEPRARPFRTLPVFICRPIRQLKVHFTEPSDGIG